MKSVVRKTAIATLILGAGSGCLTLDPFLYTPEVVEMFGWDDDPCDPQLAGELAEVEHQKNGAPAAGCHPSFIPADSRHEGFVQAEGRQVHYVFAHRENARATIFYSHGRSKHLGRYWDRVERLWQLGFSVLIYDYPGYGRSEGEPNEAGIRANAMAAVELLPTLVDVDAENVYFMGYSMGGAPTLAMALFASSGAIDTRPRALVTESAFCSTETLIEDGSYLNLPVEFLAENAFDNCSALSQLDGEFPVLIMHGAGDSFVLPVHAKKLLAASEGEAELFMVAGADHIELPGVGGEAYVNRLVGFLSAGGSSETRPSPD
ncbi:MAG: alpha/beta hydrolase [Nannocystaceae bacterium]